MRKRPAGYRRATYPAATRLGQLLLLLAASPDGLPVAVATAALGVSPRTWFRYQNVLKAVCGEEVAWGGSRVRLREGWARRVRVHAPVANLEVRA